MPRTAARVTTVWRGANSYGDLVDDFFISRVKSGSHWLLWERGEAQEDDSRYCKLRGWCPARSLDRKEAAAALLHAWFREAEENWPGHYDDNLSVYEDGVLSEEEVGTVLTRALAAVDSPGPSPSSSVGREMREGRRAAGWVEG